MDLTGLIEALSTPAAYPYPVEAVEVRQTHISAVFLAGPNVYKVKKPVKPGFLDFSTLEKRRHFCEEQSAEAVGSSSRQCQRSIAATADCCCRLLLPTATADCCCRLLLPTRRWAISVSRLPVRASSSESSAGP